MPLTLTRSDNVPRLIHAAPIGICITDEDGLFEMANPAYCAFSGYAEAELLGRPFTLLMPEADREALIAQHRHFMQGDEEHDERREWEVICRSGERRSVIAESSRLEDDAGRPKRVTFITDITERKAMEQRLDFLARHDDLTGLLNRRAGMARLEEEIARSHRQGTSLCVAIADLDQFKLINDRYGHATGDDVLAGVTELMQGNLRRYDILARMGGEEFLLILPDVTLDEAHQGLERLRALVAHATLGQAGVGVTLSAGTAMLAPGEASRTLLERADRALYRAKQAGRNRVLDACGA
ncbi:GGDEF domain-containing protein [Halomonas getboli]|uniref:GGDEF domain-containing protein n=1 Tax=Halomonas getboli TaxID=2935862 RepID=UPI00200048F4|nr:sensor domain-containing diguanylate cyclase [Halomonas getboli]MCK2184078.1 sensor domain-containing diguanylate cyclase [Halomonas getboli]